MPTRFPYPAMLAVSILVFASAGAAAQTLSADEKELATYRLTMVNVKKVMAAMKSMAAEAASEPRAKEIAKLKAEMKVLQDKEELTEAENAQYEKLQERLDKLEEEIDADEEKTGRRNPSTLAEMEATVKAHPAAMRALSSAGLTPRDYARTTMALLQASLVEGFSQGKLDLAKLPPGVNPENIRFVREHKEELAAIQAEMSGKKK